MYLLLLIPGAILLLVAMKQGSAILQYIALVLVSLIVFIFIVAHNIFLLIFLVAAVVFIIFSKKGDLLEDNFLTNERIKNLDDWEKKWSRFEATFRPKHTHRAEYNSRKYSEYTQSARSTSSSSPGDRAGTHQPQRQYGEKKSTKSTNVPDFYSNNPLEVLGVSMGATPKEIQLQYRKLIKLYHPDVCSDKNKSQAEFITRKLTWAYRELEKTLK